MINKRKLLFYILLIMVIGTLFTAHYILDSVNKTIIISKLSSLNLLAGSEITTLEKPTNLLWKEGSTATAKWDAVENANYYVVNVYLYDLNNQLLGSIPTGTATNELDLQQEIYELLANVSMDNYYITYDVTAEYISDDNTVDSSVSDKCVAKLVEKAGKTKLATPTNVTLNESFNASWTTTDSLSNIWFFGFDWKFEYNGIVKYVSGTGTSQAKYGTSANVRDQLKSAYDKAGYSGETVKIAIRVKSWADYDTDYKNGDPSEYSNYIYYNPNGSTVINEVTLSPDAPVIAVGRSIYMGKTISPDSALYSVINWSTTNKNIVSINSVGMITGKSVGKATITAQINNASQTAEVNVYEIKSNIQNSNDSQNVINKANDVIEAVVSDGDISNTDITNANKAEVLNKIETGATNGDLFNVNLVTTPTTQNRIDELQDEININYSGYSIAGASDINVAISHKDSNGASHHIVNITELENEIGVTIDLSNSIPSLSDTKTREYKLVRKHNNSLENMEFEINNGIVNTDSDKFSEFILLYKDTDIPVTGINLNKESTTINVGDSETITVTVLPENAANKNYTSVSSDETKITVIDNVITAVAPGTATVTFTSVEGNYTKDLTVTVIKPLISISLNKTSGALNVGEIEDLTVTYNPSDTTDNKTITWTSSNNSIASVNNFGKVTAVAPGKATITARVGNKSATYVVDVKLPLTSISLNKTSGTLIAEREELLTVTYNPSNTTDDKTITWTSSKPEVATVVDGYVRAINAGNTIITAKVGEKTATYELTVIPRIALTSISLNKTSETLNVGQEQNLVVTYNPTDTNDDKTITWATSNAAIATVNNGKVKAISPGKATITAKVGEKTATYVVDIKSPLINISLNKTSGSLGVEETETLAVAYNPNNTTDDTTVKWTSSDENVASVNSGIVNALNVGITTITATVGNKTAIYTITVKEVISLQKIITEKTYKIENELVYGFTLGESIENLKNIFGSNININTSNTIVGTGVQFSYNNETYTAVVYGDITGDESINSADLLKIRQHLLGTTILTGVFRQSAAIANRSTINSADLLRLRQHLLGTNKIIQKQPLRLRISMYPHIQTK